MYKSASDIPAELAMSAQYTPSFCSNHLEHQHGALSCVCSGGATPPEHVPVGFEGEVDVDGVELSALFTTQ